jgi:hypothetical protein
MGMVRQGCTGRTRVHPVREEYVHQEGDDSLRGRQNGTCHTTEWQTHRQRDRDLGNPHTESDQKALYRVTGSPHAPKWAWRQN